MSAVHRVSGDANATQDAEVKVPDPSVGGDPMIPVSNRCHHDNCHGGYVMRAVPFGQTCVWGEPSLIRVLVFYLQS